MARFFTAIFFWIAFSSTPIAAQIWLEDFSLPNGTVNDPAAPSIWSIDVTNAIMVPPNDYFEVRNGQMEARDVDGEVVWFSEQIDISAQTNVTISMLVSESGGMENSDYIRAYYVLDGGLEVLFGEVTNDLAGGGPITMSVGSLNGNTLSIVVRIYNNGANERWRFDDVTVSVPTNLYSIGSGNWSDGLNWSYSSGGATCNCTPGQLTQVVIEGANIINYDVTSAILGLQVTGASQLIWTGAGTTLTIIGGGSVVVDAGSSISSNGNTASELVFSAGGSAIVNDAGTGLSPAAITIEGTAVNFSTSGTGNISLSGNYYVATSASSITNDLAGSLSVGGHLEFRPRGGDNTFTNNGNISIGLDLRFNHDRDHFINNSNLNITDDIVVVRNNDIDNRFTNNALGIVTLNQIRLGNAPGFILNNSGNITTTDDILSVTAGTTSLNNLAGAIFNYGGNGPDADIVLDASAVSNHFNYTRNGSVTIINPVSGYDNLGISGTGTKSLGAVTDINGTLTNSGNLAMAGFDVTIAGDITNSGSVTTGANTVFLDGANQALTSGGMAFNNLDVAGTGLKNMQDNLDINGTLTVLSTLNPAMGGLQINLAGDLINNGTINRNNEMILFDGS